MVQTQINGANNGLMVQWQCKNGTNNAINNGVVMVKWYK